MARVYALKTYHDGSTALVKMTRREIQDANESAWRDGAWPSVKEITKREARELYREAPLDVIESSIAAEFEAENATLIHHETVTGRLAPENSETGRFDVIETADGFTVFEGSFPVAAADTLEEAMADAQRAADRYNEEIRRQQREAAARESRATIARKRTVRDRDIELRDIRARYHRNGCAGEGFTALSFRARIRGAGRSFREMIATVFEGEGRVAVVEPGNVANCWRGDDFEPLLREAVKAFDESGELYDSSAATNH